jgi:hypothetical protein
MRYFPFWSEAVSGGYVKFSTINSIQRFSASVDAKGMMRLIFLHYETS